MPRVRSTVIEVSDDQYLALVVYETGAYAVVRRADDDPNGDPIEVSRHESPTAAQRAFELAVQARALAKN